MVSFLRFPHLNIVCISLRPNAFNTLNLSDPVWFKHFRNTLWWAQIIKLAILKFSVISRHFLLGWIVLLNTLFSKTCNIILPLSLESQFYKYVKKTGEII
jgi:hypothetical protein